MPSLRDRQHELQRAILANDGGPPGVGIYRHAYRARLAGALRQNYPVLARRMGEAAFRELADEYARAHPSSHFNLRWHGAVLWRLLAGAHADLARMEWALGVAFDAADAPALDWDRLRGVPLDEWGELPLALHPSTQVLPMAWAAERLWDGGAEALPHEHALLVWRKDLQAHWRIAPTQEGDALHALGRLGTVQRTCEALPEVPIERMGAWLAGWVHEGLLTPGSARE